MILSVRGCVYMDSKEIVRMYNESGMTLVDIAKELGSSKSTISRVLAKDGYLFNKSLKKYIHETENTGNNETVNNDSSEITNNVPRETIKTVNCTFGLPVPLYKALKVKCAIEGVKMVDLVRKTLENAIENKYFDM